MRSILTATLLLAAVSPALPQDLFNSQTVPRPPLYADISGGGGLPIKSFNGDTRAALEAIGFKVTEAPNLIPARGITLFGEFNVGPTSHATMGAFVSVSGGFLSGMRNFSDRSFASVEANHLLATVGFTPSVEPVSWLRIGGGSALCAKELRLTPYNGQAVEMKDRSLGWVPKADVKIGDATGPSKFGSLANAVTREAARLTSLESISTAGENTLARRADADWARVVRLRPATAVIVTLRGSRTGERLFLTADQSEVALLRIDPDLPGTARVALWLMATRRPEDLTGAMSSVFVHENARVGSDGVFVNGRKVADLRDIVQRISRSDITEVTVTGGSAHTFWDDFGELFMIGTILATTIGGGMLGYEMLSSQPPLGAVAGSVVGYYVGLGTSYWMSDIAGRDRVIYHGP